MNSPRYRIPLQDDWTFRQGKVHLSDLPYMEDLPSARISLPHTWNTHDTFRENVDYHRGWGSYSRVCHIPVDLTQGLWFLVTEGFYGTGDLSVNGSHVARVDGQYLGLNEDLTSYLRPGQNHIGLRLTNDCAAHVLPGIAMPDFILYGGLSGRAWLEYRPSIHLDTDNWLIRDHGILTQNPGLFVSINLVNDAPGTRQVTVVSQLHALDGRGVIAQESTVVTSKRGSSKITHALNPGPLDCWTPDRPRLYCITTELWIDGALVDQAMRQVGFRQAIFQSGAGFFLNGERIQLRGVNRHEEIPGFGRAIPAPLHVEDVKAIHAMGCNFVRLSHYPQSPDFLDACDAHGLMVFPEIATWKSVRTGPWLKAAQRQMRAMIRRDRHHPSVILWGMGNESRSRTAFNALSQIVRNEDPIRPTIYAENHLYRARRENTIGLPDVWGLNYELDALPDALQASTLKNVIVSECSNHPHTARGHRELEVEQLVGLSADLDRIDNIPGVAGFCLWSFADYATLRKRRYRRFSGMVDGWRLPKLAYFILQARYRPEPMLHVEGTWNVRDTAPTRSLIIITNGRPDKACLLKSKQSVPFKDIHPIARHCWQVTVPFFNEPLEIFVSFASGPQAAMLYPWGAAAALTATLRPIPHEGPGWLSQLDVTVTDSAGHLCSDWEGIAHINVPASCRVHTCFPNNNMSVAAGTGRTYLSGPSGLAHPTLQVTAAPDLKSPTLSLY